MRTKLFTLFRDAFVTTVLAGLIVGVGGVGVQVVAIVILLTAFREPAADWLRACYADPVKILPRTDRGRSQTAFHEAGHAVVGWVLPGADKPRSASIRPNAEEDGRVDCDDRRDPHDLLSAIDELAAWFAGAAAEREFGSPDNSGCWEDLERATAFARRMVCEWGFSGKLAKRRYDPDSGLLTEEILTTINAEIDRFLGMGEQLAIKTVKEHHDTIGCVAALLLQQETLDAAKLQAAIGTAPTT